MDPITAVTTAFAIIAGVIGIWQKLKAGKSAAAYDQAQATIAALALAVETAPMPEDRRIVLKARIHQLATAMETEEAVLAPVVRDITALANEIIQRQGGGRLTANGEREALAAWKQARQPSGKAPVVAKAGLLMLLATLALSCASKAPQIECKTIPGDGDAMPTVLMVLWPEGASADPADYVTVWTTDGMVTVAPITEESTE